MCVCVRLSLGDWAGPLLLGEVSWPLVYGVAVDLLGSDLVHRYVGVEEFSRYDSPFALTKTGPGPAALSYTTPSFHTLIGVKRLSAIELFEHATILLQGFLTAHSLRQEPSSPRLCCR